MPHSLKQSRSPFLPYITLHVLVTVLGPTD